MSIFDRRLETISRHELEQLQLERLQALLVRLKRNVRRHREKLGEVSVQSLDDLKALPVTTPEDMADSFPYGMLAFPLRRVTYEVHDGGPSVPSTTVFAVPLYGVLIGIGVGYGFE